MILTAAELRKLTGYREPAEQIRVLRARGVYPYVDSRGNPQVTWAVINDSMRSGAPTMNLEAINGAATA